MSARRCNAAYQGDAHLAATLLAAGAHPNAVTDTGMTPLLMACEAGNVADGLVRVGVQSSQAHPETAALLRRMMKERGMPVPPEGRTLQPICVSELCR